MWADTETDVDFLNYSEIAELVAEMISDDTLLPLSLGIFGGWGIGKSSTLNLVASLLEEKPDRYLIVRFDAWFYQGFDDARAALMSVIVKALAEAAPDGLKKKAGGLIKRVNKVRLLGMLVEGRGRHGLSDIRRCRPSGGGGRQGHLRRPRRKGSQGSGGGRG